MATTQEVLKVGIAGLGFGSTEFIPTLERLPQIKLVGGADLRPQARNPSRHALVETFTRAWRSFALTLRLRRSGSLHQTNTMLSMPSLPQNMESTWWSVSRSE